MEEMSEEKRAALADADAQQARVNAANLTQCAETGQAPGANDVGQAANQTRPRYRYPKEAPAGYVKTCHLKVTPYGLLQRHDHHEGAQVWVQVEEDYSDPAAGQQPA